jgi:hypothetical protein
VPAGALACPECGSDAESGWSDEAGDWAGGLPTGYDDGDEGDDLDYEDFLREEGLLEDGVPSKRATARRKLTVVVAVLVVLVLLWSVFLHR